MTAAAFEVAEVQESKTGSEQYLSKTKEHVHQSQVVMFERAKWADRVALVDCRVALWMNIMTASNFDRVDP